MRDLICDVIKYCASSFAVETLSVYDQVVIKILKITRGGHQRYIYVNFHLKDDLRMEFIVY